MPRALVWFLKRWRPSMGWAPLVLALVAQVCLPAALISAAGGAGRVDALSALSSLDVALLLLSVASVLTAMAMAATWISCRRAMTLGALTGAGFAVVVVGRLLPTFSMWWADLAATSGWTVLLRRGSVGWLLPVPASHVYAWDRLNGLGSQLWWELQRVADWDSVWYTQAYQLLALLIIWMLGLVAGWWVFRKRRPMLGLLPTGVALSTVAFVHPAATRYLLIFLFCLLWLLAVIQLWSSQERWERGRTDHPGDLGLELALAIGPWIAVVILLAGFFPTAGFGRVSRAFWEQAEKVVGPLDSGYGHGYGTGRGSAGRLPNAHLLGGSPELADTVVFYVQTTDPPPRPPDLDEAGHPSPDAPQRYWRGATLNVYTGQGWANSPLEARPVGADTELQATNGMRDPLHQRYELQQPDAAYAAYAYGVNALSRLDQPVEAWWRSPGDFAFLETDARAYTVVSYPPAPSVEELRGAHDVLPPVIADQYLELPDTVPQRVVDLAQEVTRDARNRYDKTKGLEAFLRTYTYTLDLPTPPAGKDVVDYFLFDVQQGYCDYYASALVVMARAVGIPARFATGYAQGTFDHDVGRWMVAEDHAHSWPEVYFEGIGWVEFEPTAGLPSLDRQEAQAEHALRVPPRPDRATGWWSGELQILLLGFALLAVIIVVLLLLRVRLRGRGRELADSDVVRDRYGRLIRWGALLDHPPQVAETPVEYGAGLARVLRTRGESSRWHRVREAGVDAGPEILRLTECFVRAQYAEGNVTSSDSLATRRAWKRLRTSMWWLRLGK